MIELFEVNAGLFVAMIVNMHGEEQHCQPVLDETLAEYMMQCAEDTSIDHYEDESIQNPS